MNLTASPEMKEYFKRIKQDCFSAYEIAQQARKKGYDPSTDVEITLAETAAERVVGLISILAPQIKESKVDERIEELEKQYGTLDWRVAMVIALEVAQEKHCSFENKKEAIEIGVRVGFAYVTLGVVSSPIEGLTSIDIKPRRDGKGEYFRINYAGPVRNAGGTAAAVSVLITDYVRKHLGYARYDPDEKEVERCVVELEDYHNYVANLQYWPHPDETRHLMRNVPVEIGGDASEKREVSNVNLKDLPRIETNNLRSGYCLIHSSCIPLKGPKLWKRLSQWGDEMGMEDWNFLEEYLDIQKKMKAQGGEEQSDEKITPDYTYIKDLVAGRPVLAHPLRPGGMRLRYGRGRFSGFSAQSINPATMVVLDGFLATGTQLKVERPGKAAAYTPCDTIEGPIVKLFDGSVVHLHGEKKARAVKNKIAEILYIGDVLINYGDFFDRAHTLIPAGYCEEWWAQEIKKAVGEWTAKNLSQKAGIDETLAKKIIDMPIQTKPSAQDAITIAQKTGTPLHPYWTPFWKELKSGAHHLARTKGALRTLDEKPLLETLGIPHEVEDGNPKLTKEWALIIDTIFKDATKEALEQERDALALTQEIAPFKIRDKSGTFIGSRMGRPEKAKMRKLTGSPHTLFPIGEQGGRLRSFQAAMDAGYVNSAFPKRRCDSCDIITPLFRCELCDEPTTKSVIAPRKSMYGEDDEEPVYDIWDVPIKRIFDGVKKKLGMRTHPDLIKGVRGTSNQSHIPEHPGKGILRAHHGVHVNKDGTVRYDASEVTMTHFTPKEVFVSVERLKELGYTKDAKGLPLEREDQVLELKPQDVVLPCCETPGYPDEAADKVLGGAARFVDDLLVKLYGLEPYYNLKTNKDLAGHYIIGLAPHTSAGIVGRIIGFSKTQGFFAHPLFHAAMRRDCDGDESCFVLLADAFLNFSRYYLPESRGGTMDAPLVLTYLLNPAEVDDMVFNMEMAWEYPLELYEAALEYKKPWDVPLERVEDCLGTERQFEGLGYTHETSDLNIGVLCSSYKTLPSMGEKLEGQLKLAKKIRACDESDVARLVITKHFMRDTKGNLGKFSQQQFRCVNCNAKYRRPPLRGACTACGKRIIFTITEGSVIKYLEPSLKIARDYNVPTYLQQDLELTKRRVEANFGKDPEKQEALEKFFA